MIKVKLLIVLAIFGFHLSKSVAIDGGDSPQKDAPAVNYDDFILVGDTMLSKKQYRFLYSNDTVKRHGIADPSGHWPRGEVPIVISPYFPKNYRQKIKEAAHYIEEKSCIKFLFKFNPSEHPNFVKIIYEKGVCWSLVGLARKGEQNIKLDPQKCVKGSVIHELLHTLGFFHMHTAVDRDNFVQIHWKNIKPEFKNDFKKHTNQVSMFQTSYDFRSIMHFPPSAHAINPEMPTISTIAKVSNVYMGQCNGMTDGDITRLKRMYKCKT